MNKPMKVHPETTMASHPNAVHPPQSLGGGMPAQLCATIREVVSHRIRMAAETTNIIIATKPISVAQMYLSQLITSFPFGCLGWLTLQYHAMPCQRCRLLCVGMKHCRSWG
jgi:hypothetical protein